MSDKKFTFRRKGGKKDTVKPEVQKGRTPKVIDFRTTSPKEFKKYQESDAFIQSPTTKPNAFIKEEPKKDITPNEFIASVEANKKRIEELRQDYDSYNKEMSSPEAITEALTSPDFPLIGNTGNSVVRLLSAIGSNEENKLRKYGEIAASGLNLGIGVIPPMALISAASPFAKGVTRPIGDAVGLKRTTTDFLTEMGLAAPLGLPVVGGMLGAHGVGEGTKAALKSYTDLPEKDIDLASELAGHLGFFGGMPVGKKVGKGLDKTKKKLDDVVKKDIDKLFGETTLTKSLDGDYVDVSRRTEKIGRTSKPIGVKETPPIKPQEKVEVKPKEPIVEVPKTEPVAETTPKATEVKAEPVKKAETKVEKQPYEEIRGNPFKIAEEVSKELKNRGIEQGFSESKTDFGESAYGVFYKGNEKIKIRISDHSVENRQRMQNEMLVDAHRQFNPQKIADNIERLQYPERYEFIENKSGGYIKEGIRGDYKRVKDYPDLTKSVKAEPVKEIKDNTNYIQSLKESIHSRLQWNKNDTGTQKRKYLKEARDLATKLRQEGINAKIERAKKGWKLYIDNKPQGKRELGLIERGETVKAKDVEITSPEASKPFKELPKEVRDRQEIISEMFVEANDLPKGIGQKQLEKGVKDIKDNAGKEQSPEAKIVRDVAETIIKEGKEIKIGKGSSKTEFIEQSEIKRVIDEAIERKSIIDESGDTSFNFGANVGEFKLTEPKTPTTKKKPNEQIEMEGLGGRKFPDKPITGKGKGEETTPLFEPTTETKGQIKMFEPTKEGIKPEAPKGSNAVKVEFESGKKAELLLKDADTLQGIKDPIKKIDYGKVEFTKDGKVKWDSFSEVNPSKIITKESPPEVRVKGKRAEKLGYASVGDVKPLSQRAEGSVEQFRVSERAKSILKELDIPINEKLIPRRLLGLYKHATDAVRVQSLNDVTTVVHEAAHAISKRSKLGENVWKDRRTVKELTDIYEEYYPGAKRTHKKDKRVEEGIAVLLENYFYNPTEVMAKFPILVNKFIKSDGKYHRKEFEFLLDKMGELAGDYAKMSPEQRIASRVRSGEEVIKSQNSGFTFPQRLVYNLFNRFEPLNRVAKIGGVRETWQDPTVSAFNWMNRNSHIANWVEGDRATILQRDGNMKYSDATMKKVIKLIQGKEKEFDTFLIARRVVENHNEMVRLKNNDMLIEASNLAEIMRKDNISLQDAQAVLSKYRKDFSLPIKIYDRINKNLIDFAENTGLIASDIANTFRETKGYASFKRFVNDELGNEFIGTVSTNPKTKVSSFKARTGSNLDIVSPLYNQMTSISEIISKGYENMIWRKVYDLSLKDKEIARRFEELNTITAVDGQGRISFPQDRDPSLIKVMVDGKRKYIKPTPDFIEVAKNLRGAEWDAFTSILRLPASVFTRLTTSANPMFAFGNATIDQISMGMQTKTKAIPIIDPVKNLPNFLKEMAGKDSMLKDYLDAGGKRQTVADFYRVAPEDAVKKLSGNLSKGEKLGNVIDKGISILELPSNYSEYMSRFSEFKRSVEAGEPASVALYRASEVTTPFQLYGNWGGKVGQSFIKSLPYFNAIMQVSYKYGRNIKEQPERVASWTAGLVATGLTTAIATMQSATEEQKRLLGNQPARELARGIYFGHPNGKDLMRIRIPEQVGAITGSIYLYVIQNYGGNKATFNDYLDASTSFIPEQFNIADPSKIPFAWTPQVIKPTLQVMANKKTYPELAPIVPYFVEKYKSPKDQYTSYTSDVGKFTGELLNISPMKIDYFIRNQFGAVGGMFLGKLANNPLIRREGEYITIGRAYNNFWQTKEDLDIKRKEVKDNPNYNNGEISKLNSLSKMYNKTADLFKKMNDLSKTTELSEEVKDTAYKLLLSFENGEPDNNLRLKLQELLAK